MLLELARYAVYRERLSGASSSVSMVQQGCDDSTPVRGASYEPAVLSGVSAEPRLSHDTSNTRRGFLYRMLAIISILATVASPTSHEHNHDCDSSYNPIDYIGILPFAIL
jgi:hypothetical protein